MANLLDKYKIGGVDFVRPFGSLQGTLNTSAGEDKISAMPTPQATPSSLPQGNGAQINSEQTPQGGSLVDFQTVMRAISKDAYEKRSKSEGKVMAGQFDPSKVSGSVFKSIMDSVEGNRGGDISKVYASSVEAAKFDIEQQEKKRQFDEKIGQENEAAALDNFKKKIDMGMEGILIPQGSPASKNNNPGNLKFAGQRGAVEGIGGFARFGSPEEGFQALVNQIQLNQSRGDTLATFITEYAPPNENNTALYIQQMSQWLNVDSNTPLSSIDAQQVAVQIAKKESSTQIFNSKIVGNDNNSKLKMQFEGLLVGFPSVAKQESARKQFEVLSATGNEENVKQYIKSIARETMTGSQKENYDLMDLVNQENKIALGIIGEGKQNIDFYKNFIEDKKPYLDIQKDQEWVGLVSQIERSQSQFRKALYGTALTGTEQANANNFLVNSKDDITTIETKLRGMNEFTERARERMLNAVIGEYGTAAKPDESKFDMFANKYGF